MMYVYIVIGIIAGWFVLNLVGGIVNRYGAKTTVDQMQAHIDTIMRGGMDRTRLRLRHDGLRRRVDFVKLVPRQRFNPPNEPTQFRMVLDSRTCSDAEFDRAQQVLSGAGIDYEVKREPKDGYDELIVECGLDLEEAADAARRVLVDALGVPPHAALRAGYIGACDSRATAFVGWGE